MRQIQFRIFHKEQGAMYEDEGISWIDFNYGKAMLIDESDEGDVTIEVDFSEIELMQFTGLTDKNGKEIYEGDIIATNKGEKAKFNTSWGIKQGQSLEQLWVVEPLNTWNDNYSFYGLCVTSLQTKKLYNLDQSIHEKGEVIGNIYENKELLS